MNSLGIAVVAHNSEREIGGCLESLRPLGAEVVVVDNASGDRTVDAARREPGVRLLANPWNRGFAAAANQGIGALDTPYVLLLNPDVRLIDSPEPLVEACSRPGVAAAGGKLLGEDGRPQTGFMARRLPAPANLALEVLGVNRCWPGNPWNRKYRCLDLPPDAPADIEQPPGAFLLVKREAWRKIGGFDENFRPVWFEDVDFCCRLKQAGYRIVYVPHVTATHKGGHSVGQLGWEVRGAYWYGNLLTYAAKHYRASAVCAVCGAVVLGSALRALAAVIRSGSLKPITVYDRVVRLAVRACLARMRRPACRQSCGAAGQC
jgi:N-acetylglucosaminyl-diphospho-decaprenol L-rhamnosyltransferase